MYSSIKEPEIGDGSEYGKDAISTFQRLSSIGHIVYFTVYPLNFFLINK